MGLKFHTTASTLTQTPRDCSEIRQYSVGTARVGKCRACHIFPLRPGTQITSITKPQRYVDICSDSPWLKLGVDDSMVPLYARP